MIISSLILENIRSYDSAHFTFQEGITFLSGDIGSGKSSILQGIEFAFFGFKRNELDGNQLLRNGTSSGSVTLEIKKGTSTIEIYRTLKKTKTGIVQENGYIKIDGALIELTPTQINAQVYEILNLPKSFISKDRHLIYRFSIYTPQEQLKEILYAQHDKRLEVIRKLFSIDKYKQLTTGIEYYLKDLREKKITLKTRLEDKKEIEDTYKQTHDEIILKQKELDLKNKEFLPLKDSLEKIKSQREEKLKTIETYQEKFVILTSSLEKLEYYNKRKTELEEEIKQIEDSKKSVSLENLEKSLKTKEKNRKDEEEILVKKKNEYERLLEEQKYLQKYLLHKEKITSLKNQIEKKETKNSQDLYNTLKKVEKEIEKNDLEITKEKEITSKKQQLDSQIYVLNKSLEDFEKEITSIQHQNTCSTCKQEISPEHKAHIEKEGESKKKEISQKKKLLQEQITALEKELLHIDKTKKTSEMLVEKKIILQQEIKSFEKEKEKEKELTQEIKKLESQLQEPEITSPEKLAKLLDESQKTIDQSKDQIAKNQLEIEQIRNQIEKYENLKEKEESIKEKILKIQEQLQKKDSLVEKKEKIEKIISKLKSQQQEIQKEVAQKEPIFSKLQVEITQISTALESLKKTFSQMELKKKELNKSEEELEKLLEKEQFLLQDATIISSTIEKKLFTRFYITATHEFQRIFKELIEDQELDVRLNEEFSILIEQNGYDIDIKHLSGGEKSSLAIAYKLALKKTIESFFPQEQYLDVLLFDEPTDGFSAEQVQRLGQVLKELEVKQIFLVSHDEKIESIATQIISIDKKNHLSSFS